MRVPFKAVVAYGLPAGESENPELRKLLTAPVTADGGDYAGHM